ncbi:hypothetical protein GQ55_7G000200 [Panicum hallii var. hallii]|uniref:Uncharacterized protein n=1 Tax=Panicum hallii var. hallii TaxID=1504633 RepID=A0A2T7CRI7_9POAL|nr:hypothetical protein GQ55_7G000200 [Panicum hallii var. hallii]
MIVDFIDLSSDDDKVVAQYVDLISDEDDFEGEHLAYGQGDAAQSITFLKQEFVADDGQAEAAQCTGTLQMQELGAYDGQANAARSTAILQMQEVRADDGQANAAQSTNTMQELTVDDGQGDAAQGTATLQVLAQKTKEAEITEQNLLPQAIKTNAEHTESVRKDLLRGCLHSVGSDLTCTWELPEQNVSMQSSQEAAAVDKDPRTPTSVREPAVPVCSLESGVLEQGIKKSITGADEMQSTQDKQSSSGAGKWVVSKTESGAAVTDPLGGSIPKRLRTAGSVVAGAGWASTVEELVQQAAGRLVQQAKAGNASAGMVVDAVLELLSDALGVASPPAGSSDTAVVMALGAVYKQLTMERLNEEVAVETARDL